MNEIFAHPVRTIINRLLFAGYEVYVVGGYVRDKLRGLPAKDCDVATNATPEKIAKLFSDFNLNSTGTMFKVMIVEGVEVATYRTDTYFGLSAKNCEIAAAKTIHEDLARRDFTINSLALCPFSGNIVDEFGGKEDLKNGIIRFTGDPEKRIYEDPCRILRACRFLAAIEGKFDPETLEALKRNVELVKQHVTPERINLEIIKSLKYRRPSIFFKALHDIGILGEIFPSLEACYGFDGGPHHGETVFDHSMIVGDAIPAEYPALRLSGYLHDVGKPVVANYKEGGLSFEDHEKESAEIAGHELKKLKFSNDDINFVKGYVRYHMRQVKEDSTPKSVRRLIKALKEADVDYQLWLMLKEADRKGNLNRENYTSDELQEMRSAIECELNGRTDAAFGIKDLAVNGQDIMEALEIKPGPKVGETLKALLEAVLDEPGLNNQEDLLKLAVKLNN